MTDIHPLDGEPFSPSPEAKFLEAHDAGSFRFEPDSGVVRALKELCKNRHGFDTFRIEWRADRGCLCVMEYDKRGYYALREELRDPKTLEPRQCHMGDVSKVAEAIASREEFLRKFFQKRDELRAQARDDRKELVHETVEEMVRVANYGLRTYVELGNMDKKTNPDGQAQLVVTDTRRSFAE